MLMLLLLLLLSVVLQVVGQTAILVCAFSLAPFIVMVLWGKGACRYCMHADTANYYCIVYTVGHMYML
jgi:hypothetical protein